MKKTLSRATEIPATSGINCPGALRSVAGERLLSKIVFSAMTIKRAQANIATGNKKKGKSSPSRVFRVLSRSGGDPVGNFRTRTQLSSLLESFQQRHDGS